MWQLRQEMERGLPSVSSLPSLPCSPQLLTTSGYTCFTEFRFQTERCLALVFCRASIKSRHVLSLSGPVVRDGEPLTACRAHTPFKPHQLLLPPHPLAFLSSQPQHTHLSPLEQIKEWKVPSMTGHRRHHFFPLFLCCQCCEVFIRVFLTDVFVVYLPNGISATLQSVRW